MTVRNTKRLIAFVIVLLVITSGLNIYLGLRRPGHGLDYFEMAMPLFIVLVFAGTWQRLSKLEAEHGPDYVQATPPYARKLLIGLALLALVLGAVAGYLIVTHNR